MRGDPGFDQEAASTSGTGSLLFFDASLSDRVLSTECLELFGDGVCEEYNYPKGKIQRHQKSLRVRKTKQVGGSKKQVTQSLSET